MARDCPQVRPVRSGRWTGGAAGAKHQGAFPPTVMACRELTATSPSMQSQRYVRGNLWAIPTKDRNRWAGGEGRWITTGAVLFGELSEELNQSATTPKVGDRQAYKPIVKLVRQIRSAHLGDERPGGLYLEFATFDAWRSGSVGRKRVGYAPRRDARTHSGPLRTSRGRTSSGSSTAYARQSPVVGGRDKARCGCFPQTRSGGEPSASNERRRRHLRMARGPRQQ